MVLALVLVNLWVWRRFPCWQLSKHDRRGRPLDTSRFRISRFAPSGRERSRNDMEW